MRGIRGVRGAGAFPAARAAASHGCGGAVDVKVMIVVLVAIAVAVVLVLFYGALRPQGDPDGARGGVDGGLGWLSPRPTIEFEDVAGEECADADAPGFTVVGAACSIPLPDRTQIILCTPTADTVLISTDGRDYPAQSVKQADLSCADPRPIPIYDAETVLTLRCAFAPPCIVQLVEER